MKFYDRDKELKVLHKNWLQSSNHSMMTTVIGRRRTGKTSLLLRSTEGQSHLYLYISKGNEQVLCKNFQMEAESLLGIHFYGNVTSFKDLFQALMDYGRDHHYTLILDEFQNVLSINKSIPSDIQDIWDRNKDISHVNLILCGSIYSMMHRIFDNGDEPLYGRRDSHLRLLPFSTATLKKILFDHNPNYNPDDLLCLYMLTGGVAKYVSLLMDANATTRDTMLDYAFAVDSPFLTEGTELVVSEFGRDYGSYFSILQLIATGHTTQSEIDSMIGKNTGAYLKNLSDEYALISRTLPVLSKPGSRNIHWQVDDCFLRFWFRFVYPYFNLIESNQLKLLRNHVGNEYEQFTGRTLERYFQSKLMESGEFTHIGNWWDRKGVNEIDILALNEITKTGKAIEVKRNPNRIKLEILRNKVAMLPAGDFGKYKLEILGLSLADM